MLGRLDDPLSCANSRFFRIALYADPRVSDRLRREFVLHWSEERAAPRIKIDYGDGRVIERTITGNSVHYALDAEGRPVDALPGLMSPAAFVCITRVMPKSSDGSEFCGLFTIQLPMNWNSCVGPTTQV